MFLCFAVATDDVMVFSNFSREVAVDALTCFGRALLDADLEKKGAKEFARWVKFYWAKLPKKTLPPGKKV